MSNNQVPERSALIRKPVTEVRRGGETKVVAYNPGLMSADRASDLVGGGMLLFCAPLYLALGHQYLALGALALALLCLFEGIKKPREESAPAAEIYEREPGKTVRYDPGLMTVGRAVRLILSGIGFMEAPIYLISGHPMIAVALVLMAAYMFNAGIKRPQERKPALTEKERKVIAQIDKID